MFGDLENILNFNSSSPLKGKSILITERGADGSFMLHHLIATYLRGGHYVCLVGLAQTFTHYSCVAAKLSLNLAASRDAGQFVFIDALRTIGDEIRKGSNDAVSSDLTTRPTCVSSKSTPASRRLPLQDFYETIKSGLDQLSEWKSKPTLLVVDELSLLLILGHSANMVSILAHQLQLLVCPTDQSQGTFGTLIHTDASANDREIDLLQNEISHRCHQLIYIDRLKTGYCREVTGEEQEWLRCHSAMVMVSKGVQQLIFPLHFCPKENFVTNFSDIRQYAEDLLGKGKAKSSTRNITVECRDASTGGQEREKQRMHFKVTDKTVALFPRGLSAAVL